MSQRSLIELLKDLTEKDDMRICSSLLERCLNTSISDLENFTDKLSQLLRDFPDVYIPTLQIFISYLCDESSRKKTLLPNRRERWVTAISDFISSLITTVIMQNFDHSDFPGFGELIHDCIELLWKVQNISLISNKGNNLAIQMTKSFFKSILNAGVLGILVTDPSGRRCLKRILFDFNMINHIEREELLRAIDMVAALVEKCSEHEEVSISLSEWFLVYKACTSLLNSLRRFKNVEKNQVVNKKEMPLPALDDMVKLDNKESRTIRKPFANSLMVNSNSLPVSTQDERNLAILGMRAPQKLSVLPNFLHAIEQRKIDSFRNLIGFLSCAGCRKQALVYFSPEKYFWLTDIENERITRTPDRLFRLPFEFDDDDRLGPWDILLSGDTIKHMRNLESHLVIKAVMKKLGQISSGEWDKNKLRCAVATHDIPVYEIEIPGNSDLKILWQVDYGFSIRSYLLTQFVRVWAVTADREQIRKILENLLIVHRVYTLEHKFRCEVEQMGGVILPKTFGDEEETRSIEENLDVSEKNDERLLDIHKMLVTNKFVPLSANLYKSLVLGGFDFTFQVSKIEYEIINNPTSAIVIGRSGTGKTTCILFRQIASHLNSQLSKTPISCGSDRFSHKRQIFITVSYKLCRRVKEYFIKLRESAMLAGKKMSMKQFNEYMKKKGKEEEIPVNNNTMLEEGDEEKELSDIPNSFRQLTDHHFPLFITYEKFSKMLQGTYCIDILKLIKQQNLDNDNAADLYEGEEKFRRISSITNTTNNSSEHFVDYNKFKKDYWPHLNKQNLDCGLIYSEFSIIKGSNPDVDYLSREDYRAISTKKYPMFRHNRDQVYDLFQQYEKKMKRNDHYDSMDRTLAILRCAKMKALGGPQIHEVYIDECQDNQIVDLALILKIFERVDAIFLAGDIAQCIAPGSSFRFQDLRALMYKWELNRIQVNHKQHSNLKPKQFELKINYRSHNGILRLAASVIQLIWDFFPDSIDYPSKEHAEIGGPLPVFFDGFQERHFEDYFASQNISNNIEFGADQVIIVRNNEAKSRIRKLIGDAGLVMTIFEAKGMEFDDVLLYNFFSCSPAQLKWRVILSKLKDNSEGIQVFSHEIHYILSSELKHLYVAVTRARQHIWICDDNADYSRPIKKYWKSLGLIKIIQSVNEIRTFSTFAKKSTLREWDQRGKTFFEQRLFSASKKSKNEESRDLAVAYNLQQIAKNASDNNTAKSNFIHAAEAFIKCNRPIQAASCYEHIGMYVKSGEVYANCNMFEHAGNCYIKAKMMNLAGEYFEKAEQYIDAFFTYKDGGLYGKAITLIQRHRKEIDENIIRAEAENLRSRGKYKKAADLFICLNNDEDIIEALQCLLHLCRVNVLKSTITDITIPSTSQELEGLLSKIAEFRSQLVKKSELLEEFQLYSAYFNKDLDEVYEYLQIFKTNENIVFEFRALNIWLQILPQSGIQAEYWKNRLQCLYRLCDLIFPVIVQRRYNDNIDEIYKDFENIFIVSNVKNRLQKRKIFPDNSLVRLIENMCEKNDKNMTKKNMIKIMDNQHVYDVHVVHQAISQFLASHIYELILDAGKKGKDIPEIGSYICKYTNCRYIPNCRDHHVTSTPLILNQRLNLACLQCTVVQRLQVLCRQKLFSIEQTKEFFGIQRWWVEKLIKVHVRYQSPQTSCPEVTHMVIAGIPDKTRYGFTDLAHNKWLRDEFNNGSDFEVMLKYVFLFQLLRDGWGFRMFDWKMSQVKEISQPDDLPAGFEYKGYHLSIPVGKRLSSFFFFLYSNKVIEAISNLNPFIQYAIINSQKINLTSIYAFGDLTTLIELSTSLVFSVGPKDCKFCLPRAYLVNYFDKFTMEPLLPQKRRAYKIDEYLAAIKNVLNQIQLLLDLLICKEPINPSIILRLIRLLVLIGLNESTFEQDVFKIFERLHKKNEIFPVKIKNYLNEKKFVRLVDVLHKDLMETGCDSLVIIHYNNFGSSKFSNLEKHGIVKITYQSIEEFLNALRQIMSSVARNTVSENRLLNNMDWSRQIRKFWNLQIHDSPRDQEAAKKIQTWFRETQERRKRTVHDPTFEKIYNEVRNFCQEFALKRKGEIVVRKYNMLLRGSTVDKIVELTKLLSSMDKNKNYLGKLKKRDYDLEICVELEEELTYVQEEVEQLLDSLSIIENMEKHEEADIEWLENELQQAKSVIDKVLEWIEKCESLD